MQPRARAACGKAPPRRQVGEDEEVAPRRHRPQRGEKGGGHRRIEEGRGKRVDRGGDGSLGVVGEARRLAAEGAQAIRGAPRRSAPGALDRIRRREVDGRQPLERQQEVVAQPRRGVRVQLAGQQLDHPAAEGRVIVEARRIDEVLGGQLGDLAGRPGAAPAQRAPALAGPGAQVFGELPGDRGLTAGGAGAGSEHRAGEPGEQPPPPGRVQGEAVLGRRCRHPLHQLPRRRQHPLRWETGVLQLCQDPRGRGGRPRRRPAARDLRGPRAAAGHRGGRLRRRPGTGEHQLQ